MTDKQALRRFFIQKRGALTGEERRRAEDVVFNRLICLPAYQSAKTVMLFVSFGTECDTRRLVQYALSQDKKVFVPYCDPDRDEMNAVQIHSMKELIPGKHGILAPAGKPFDQAPKLDFVLTPGLAFDLEGYRLGYGRGYYDRFFDSLLDSAVRVGVGFDFQITENLPHNCFDCPVHAVVTDRRLIWISSER